ncbi:MAG: DUF1501 domain-containing protein [Planctomycetaceae bacterium]|nr:DUF1501 domain-containing protein [Planctomycetaceae bacterium]MCA9030465.1 DUF1501 domain-containing protein [Planctomycetaceae bacterium]MCA9042891.1 DUF1501 domain-containing protein [Planctomycetaceae bacterium]MCB9950292.1 DUF1501 domain-containing protein [Planctomycetaceae bacterium]
MALHLTCDGLRRRDFLRAGALGLGAFSLSSFLRLSQAGEVNPMAKAKSAIFINLPGGPTHMDTFDLKPNANSEYRGEFNPIQTAVPGIEICEHLPLLASTMDKFVILRGVSHTLAAHRLGSEYVNSGNRPLPSLEFPGYGAVVTKELGGPDDLPPFVSIPNSTQRPGYLGVQYAPLHTNATPTAGRPFAVRGIALGNGLTVQDVEKRQGLLNKLDTVFAGQEENSQILAGLDKFSEQAYSMITSPRARKAFDISQESPAYSEKFGDSGFGQSCLLATRLVEAGVRFVTVSTGGWDTHQDNWTRLKDNLLPPLDTGLSALFKGLEEKGLLESTVVFVTGEFGRTPKINTTRNGRDHYPRCMFMLMAGGGIAGGRVIGESDENATEPLNDAIRPDDAAASFYHALGIDHTKEYHTPSGRPVMIIRDGNVIDGLFS